MEKGADIAFYNLKTDLFRKTYWKEGGLREDTDLFK
jgi:hypothetical protein